MICWISWIHWQSFLLGIAALFLLEVILAVILIMKFFRNKKDPEGEEKVVQSLTEEYGDPTQICTVEEWEDHAKRSK